MTAALVLSTALALSAVVLLTKRRRRPAASQQLTVALVVLGDIGRSPRMMYHAHSLAAHGARTLVIAYRGSALPPELANDRNLSFVYVREAPKALGDAPRALFVALLPLRVLFSTFALLYALTLGLPVTPSFYLVQVSNMVLHPCFFRELTSATEPTGHPDLAARAAGVPPHLSATSDRLAQHGLQHACATLWWPSFAPRRPTSTPARAHVRTMCVRSPLRVCCDARQARGRGQLARASQDIA